MSSDEPATLGSSSRARPTALLLSPPPATDASAPVPLSGGGRGGSGAPSGSHSHSHSRHQRTSSASSIVDVPLPLTPAQALGILGPTHVPIIVPGVPDPDPSPSGSSDAFATPAAPTTSAAAAAGAPLSASAYTSAAPSPPPLLPAAASKAANAVVGVMSIAAAKAWETTAAAATRARSLLRGESDVSRNGDGADDEMRGLLASPLPPPPAAAAAATHNRSSGSRTRAGPSSALVHSSSVDYGSSSGYGSGYDFLGAYADPSAIPGPGPGPGLRLGAGAGVGYGSASASVGHRRLHPHTHTHAHAHAHGGDGQDGGGGGGGGRGGSGAGSHGEYALSPKRWWILSLFSLAAFLNNVVCFSFAPISRQAERYYHSAQPMSWLVSVYFVTYILTALPGAKLLARNGLRHCFLLGCNLQSAGACIRLVGPWFAGLLGAPYTAFAWVLLGQTVASLGQGFFVNTPPMLSATWFGKHERTFATTVACNFNTLGVAGAYAVATLVVGNTVSNVIYASAIPAVLSVACSILAQLTFADAPPTPPSAHAAHALKKRRRHRRTGVAGAGRHGAAPDPGAGPRASSNAAGADADARQQRQQQQQATLAFTPIAGAGDGSSAGGALIELVPLSSPLTFPHALGADADANAEAAEARLLGASLTLTNTDGTVIPVPSPPICASSVVPGAAAGTFSVRRASSMPVVADSLLDSLPGLARLSVHAEAAETAATATAGTDAKMTVEAEAAARERAQARFAVEEAAAFPYGDRAGAATGSSSGDDDDENEDGSSSGDSSSTDSSSTSSSSTGDEDEDDEDENNAADADADAGGFKSAAGGGRRRRHRSGDSGGSSGGDDAAVAAAVFAGAPAVVLASLRAEAAAANVVAAAPAAAPMGAGAVTTPTRAPAAARRGASPSPSSSSSSSPSSSTSEEDGDDAGDADAAARRREQRRALRRKVRLRLKGRYRTKYRGKYGLGAPAAASVGTSATLGSPFLAARGVGGSGGGGSGVGSGRLGALVSPMMPAFRLAPGNGTGASTPALGTASGSGSGGGGRFKERAVSPPSALAHEPTHAEIKARRRLRRAIRRAQLENALFSALLPEAVRERGLRPEQVRAVRTASRRLRDKVLSDFARGDAAIPAEKAAAAVAAVAAMGKSGVGSAAGVGAAAAGKGNGKGKGPGGQVVLDIDDGATNAVDFDDNDDHDDDGAVSAAASSAAAAAAAAAAGQQHRLSRRAGRVSRAGSRTASPVRHSGAKPRVRRGPSSRAVGSSSGGGAGAAAAEGSSTSVSPPAAAAVGVSLQQQQQEQQQRSLGAFGAGYQADSASGKQVPSSAAVNAGVAGSAAGAAGVPHVVLPRQLQRFLSQAQPLTPHHAGAGDAAAAAVAAVAAAAATSGKRGAGKGGRLSPDVAARARSILADPTHFSSGGGVVAGAVAPSTGGAGTGTTTVGGLDSSLAVAAEEDPENLSIADQFSVFFGLLAIPGFIHTLITFAVAEATINAFSTFMDYELKHVFLPATIGWIGCLFIVSGLISSAAFGYLVDRTKQYKRVTVLVYGCVITAMVAFTLLTAEDAGNDALLNSADPATAAALAPAGRGAAHAGGVIFAAHSAAPHIPAAAAPSPDTVTTDDNGLSLNHAHTLHPRAATDADLSAASEDGVGEVEEEGEEESATLAANYVTPITGAPSGGHKKLRSHFSPARAAAGGSAAMVVGAAAQSLSEHVLTPRQLTRERAAALREREKAQLKLLKTAPNPNAWKVYLSIVAVGLFLGPLQPIAIEAAAECTYPVAEELSTTMLQLLANVASSVLVPLCTALRNPDTGDMHAANWVIISFVAAAGALFAFWPERLLRSESEAESLPVILAAVQAHSLATLLDAQAREERRRRRQLRQGASVKAKSIGNIDELYGGSVAGALGVGMAGGSGSGADAAAALTLRQVRDMHSALKRSVRRSRRTSDKDVGTAAAATK